MARLLGAVSFALSFVGCSDNGTAPSVAKKAPTGVAAAKKLDLSNHPDLSATVTTVATFRSKDGKKVYKKQFAQKLKAHFKNGLARAIPEAVAGANKAGGAVFAGLTDGAAFAQFTTTEGAYTPVLAAASGTLAYNYHDSQTDSVGNVYDLFAWSGDYSSPITDAWGYRNGVLIAQFHANWTPVSGGYVLADQALGSFYEDGTVAGTIVSTVSGGGGGGGGCSPSGEGCMMMTENEESFGDRVAAPLLAALDKAGCWLGPKVAYASVQCWREGAVFAGETFVLGVATYYGGPFAEKVAVAVAWWAGWPLWTDSMYNFLHCVDSRGQEMRQPRGRSQCQTNRFLCK